MHYNNMYACIHNNCYVPTSRGNLQFTVVVVVSFSKIDSRKSLSYYLYAAGRWLKAVMIYYSNLLSNISMTVSGHKSMSVYLSKISRFVVLQSGRRVQIYCTIIYYMPLYDDMHTNTQYVIITV